MIAKEKQKHLGRGLQALLGNMSIQSIDAGDVQVAVPQVVTPVIATPKPFIDNDLSENMRMLKLSLISPNAYQPRTVWNNEELEQLAESVRKNGVLEPIIVRPAGERYEIIAGERRYRASKLAGLDAIPAVIRRATDRQMLELALIENIHRSDLNPLERAKAYKNYIDTFSLTQSDASERLGENRTVVANYMRLLELPSEIKQMLTDGQLSMGHARAILAVASDDLKGKLANRAMAGRLSVREVEKLVARYTADSKQGGKKASQKSSHLFDLERKLTNQLGSKVSIDTRKGGQRGKITIEFYSLDDFDRITEQLGVTFSEEM